MEQAAAPPSPAPSNDEIHGMHQLMNFNTATSYPGEHFSPDEMAQPPFHSRYGTPSPQQGYPYEQSSYHRTRDGPMYPSAPSYNGPNDMYAYMPSERSQQPYSTPDTSPPTPSRGVKTRSGGGRRNSTSSKKDTVKGGRVEKSKANNGGKKKKKEGEEEIILPGAPTQLAYKYENVHIADIETFVNRSSQARLKEVETSKPPGRVKRPMNAFMLYRKAYQNVAKEMWKESTSSNHQMISKVCGKGWKLEPQHIKEKFDEWARIERTNHQETFPDYKFKPTKAKKSQEDEDESDEDLEDYDWAGGPQTARGRTHRNRGGQRQEAPQSIHHPYSHLMANSAPSMTAGHAPPPGYSSSYAPPRGLPTHGGYNHAPVAPDHHFYQTSITHRHRGPGLVEDVMVRKPSTEMSHAALPSNDQYLVGGQYSMPPQTSAGEFEGMVDPGLIGADSTHYLGPYADQLQMQPRWHNPMTTGDARPDVMDHLTSYDGSYLPDPSMEVLRGQESSWKVEELDAQNFDNWMSQAE